MKYIINKKYKITVNNILCGEWLNSSTSFIALYKGNGNFEDDKGHRYNNSIIKIQNIK